MSIEETKMKIWHHHDELQKAISKLMVEYNELEAQHNKMTLIAAAYRDHAISLEEKS